MKTFAVVLLLLGCVQSDAAPDKAPNGKEFPAHWGEPPRIQTRDLRPLPGGYGMGSGTLAKWIQQNLDKDKAGKGEGKVENLAALKKDLAAAKAALAAEEKKLSTYLPASKQELERATAKLRKQQAQVAELEARVAKAGKTAAEGKDRPAKESDPEKIAQLRAEVAIKEKELAEIEDFMRRARMTKPAYEAKKAEIAALKIEIGALKARLP